MSRQERFGFALEIDGAASRAWYAQAGEWDCGCGHCRNFLKLARERALPAPVLEFLDGLSVPPEKSTYVCQMGREGDRHFYQFNYRLAGRKPAGPEGDSNKQDWGSVWCGHDPYPYGAPDFPEPNFDLSFFVWLPWALDEPPDG